jgi:putative FmdB family regulatory protein
MPIYEFRCTECHKTFSESMTIAEHVRRQPQCPACGSTKVEAVLSAFFAKTIRKS